MIIQRQKLNGFIAIINLALAAEVFAAQLDWRADWERTVAAAKKEGQVTVYIYRYERLLAGFQEGVSRHQRRVGNGARQRIDDPAHDRAAGREISSRMSTAAARAATTTCFTRERRSIRSSRLLILPEVVDESKWYAKEHRYADAEGKYVFAYLASPSDAQLAYNSAQVNPKEFRSYWDVTNPKWKGKIVSLDPRDGGLGGDHAVFLLQPGDRSGVHQEILQHHGYPVCEKFPANDRLAGPGTIRYLLRLQGLDESQEPRTARGRLRHDEMEGRLEFFVGRRIAQPIEPGAAPQRRQSFYQLVPLAARARSRCRSSATPTIRRTRAGSIFPKTTCRRPIG